MRRMLGGGGGFAPLVLVIVIAWALLSVLFLTGTLLAARSIDRSVNSVTKPGINAVVEDIGTDARFIDEARKIADVSGGIATAAKPLSGQLDVIERTATTGIDPKLKSIVGQVGGINEVAGSINANVLQIGPTVDAILGNATSINAVVTSIKGKGVSILSRARSINSSARGILGSFGGILSSSQSIDDKVTTVNIGGRAIASSSAAIADGLNTLQPAVGVTGGEKTAGTLLFYANNIDCFLNGGSGGACVP